MPVTPGNTYYVLTKSDVDALRNLIDNNRTTQPNPPGQSDPNIIDQLADVYMALPPSTGVPAATRISESGTADIPGPASGDTPGSATCSIYRLFNLSGTLQLYDTGFTETVYNYSQIPVPYDFFLITRDKYGDWVVQSPAYGLMVNVRGDSDVAKGSSGTFTIYDDAWDATETTITVEVEIGAYEAPDKGYAAYAGSSWRLINTECST